VISYLVTFIVSNILGHTSPPTPSTIGMILLSTSTLFYLRFINSLEFFNKRNDG